MSLTTPKREAKEKRERLPKATSSGNELFKMLGAGSEGSSRAYRSVSWTLGLKLVPKLIVNIFVRMSECQNT